jgi:hypothetical protein
MVRVIDSFPGRTAELPATDPEKILEKLAGL